MTASVRPWHRSGVRLGRHLARRFATSLWPGGPAPADDAWARRRLIPGESELWNRLSGPDRRHAVGVGRATAALGDAEAPPCDAVLAAALLHDVGKVKSGWAPSAGPR